MRNLENPLIITFITLVDYKVMAAGKYVDVLNDTGLMFASQVSSLGKLKGVDHRTIQIEYEFQNAATVGNLIEGIMNYEVHTKELCYVCGGSDDEFGVDTYICPACQQQALLQLKSQKPT